MFGCCPDGRTPAPGPAHAGCPSEFPRKEEGTLSNLCILYTIYIIYITYTYTYIRNE